MLVIKVSRKNDVKFAIKTHTTTKQMEGWLMLLMWVCN
jgi:hypothetical protein